MGQLMQTLEVVREDIPTLAELGYEDLAQDPEMACATDGPRGFTLEDFTRGISASSLSSDTLTTDYNEPSEPVVMPIDAPVYANAAVEPEAIESSLYIQVASLSAAERAQQLSVELGEQLTSQSRVYASAGNYRVQLGPVASFSDAQALQQTLQRMGYGDAFVTNG